MADFSKNELIEDEGGVKIIFDLDEETLKELEAVLKVDRNSESFQEHFQNFVNAGIHSFLSSHGGLND
jgi:hypothetical protein